MIKFIKRIFPSLFPWLHIIFARMYDIYKFGTNCSSVNRNKNKIKLRSFITRQYHGIEKAFSLPNTKKPFGATLARELIKNVKIYVNNYGKDELITHAMTTLINYSIFHKDVRDSYLKEVIEEIKALEQTIGSFEADSTRLITIGEIEESTNFDFTKFVKTRRSIRDFAKGSVDISIIKKSIRDAIESPSACNRQGWRVRIYQKNAKDKILKYQNGNRGFNESIDKVLLITGVNSLYSYTERNGMLIDGALFAMTLLLSLHSRRVGACPLNTSYTIKDELKLRKAIGLDESEEPIMMVAVGKLRDSFKVAQSPRPSISNVLISENS